MEQIKNLRVLDPKLGTEPAERSDSTTSPQISETQFIQLEEEGALEDLMTRVTSEANLIYNVTRELRDELTLFAKQAIREPARLGFLAQPNPSVATTDLAEACRRAIIWCEEIRSMHVGSSAVDLGQQLLANDLLIKTQDFLSRILGDAGGAGVPQGKLAEILLCSLALRHDISSIMLKSQIIVKSLELPATKSGER